MCVLKALSTFPMFLLLLTIGAFADEQTGAKAQPLALPQSMPPRQVIADLDGKSNIVLRLQVEKYQPKKRREGANKGKVEFG
jgi:hypothetical protein